MISFTSLIAIVIVSHCLRRSEPHQWCGKPPNAGRFNASRHAWVYLRYTESLGVDAAKAYDLYRYPSVLWARMVSNNFPFSRYVPATIESSFDSRFRRTCHLKHIIFISDVDWTSSEFVLRCSSKMIFLHYQIVIYVQTNCPDHDFILTGDHRCVCS